MDPYIFVVQQYDRILIRLLVGAGFPVAAKKISWLKVPEKVFFACKHFGTGVLIATAFVHVRLPSGQFSVFPSNEYFSFFLLPGSVFQTHVFPISSPKTTRHFPVSS